MNFNTIAYVPILALLFLWSASIAVAGCRNDIPASTPSGDFTIHTDGTVTHHATGLMWMRCSLGQSWDGSACSGSSSTLNWADALVAAQNHTYANYTDWRLPNKNELESIVEERCINPAINSTIFPTVSITHLQHYWSSSSYYNSSTVAWVVGFDGGGVATSPKDGSQFGNGRVRLVRAGQ